MRISHHNAHCNSKKGEARLGEHLEGKREVWPDPKRCGATEKWHVGESGKTLNLQGKKKFKTSSVRGK